MTLPRLFQLIEGVGQHQDQPGPERRPDGEADRAWFAQSSSRGASASSCSTAERQVGYVARPEGPTLG